MSERPETILVPIDGSEASLRALRVAAARVRGRPGARLHLLAVRQPAIVYGEIDVYVGRDRAEAQTEEYAAHVMERATHVLGRDASVEFTTEIAAGAPAEVILRRSRELACTEIVMGTRGLGRIAAALIGSVASAVVSEADVPVTLVR